MGAAQRVSAEAGISVAGTEGDFSGPRAEPGGVPRGRAVCGGVRRGPREPSGAGPRPRCSPAPGVPFFRVSVMPQPGGGSAERGRAGPEGAKASLRALTA